MNDLVMHSGAVLKGVHPISSCLLGHCCIHNPSDHVLKNAPYEYLNDIGMFRVCEHGILHPDPDDLEFKMVIGDWITVEAITSVHLVEENCDGCCHKNAADKETGE